MSAGTPSVSLPGPCADAATATGVVRPLPAWQWPRRGAALPRATAAALAQTRARWASAPADELTRAATAWRGSRSGGRAMTAQATGEALGLAAAALQHTTGLVPYDSQLCAAWLMLDGALAEMATGEGKTLAAALAAAAAALGGTPVQVLTANDYLVQRDQAAMAPCFALLGLHSAAITAAMPREQRPVAYRQDIVYLTGRELVFDYLKDHVALHGDRDARTLRARALAGSAGAAEAVVPALRLAIVDEADSILLDEACIPFILAAQGAAPRLDALEAARALAARLGEGDFTLQSQRHDAELTARGLARLDGEFHSAGPLYPPRHGQELVRAALVAQHLMRRDRDYALVDGQVALIDTVTGRIAAGRQWTGPLHALIELKEGLAPSTASATAARITYQRFFPRYLRLGGMSGTLREAAGELGGLYGCRVVRVPLTRPSQGRWLGTSGHVTSAARWAAVALRVRDCVAAGRPVLVGTASVAASRALSSVLTAAGLTHQVLNAVQDGDEAERIAAAGRAGCVTVATNIAGRGTDIRLDAAARAAGGLHVILALANRSRRIDRQLLGRGARHGDPGSAERMLALDDELMAQWPRAVLRLAARLADSRGVLPAPLALALLLPAQRRCEWQDRLVRRDLRLADDGLVDNYRLGGSLE